MGNENRTTAQLRKMRPSDAEACQRLSTQAGWLHRVEDWSLAIDLGHGTVAVDGDEVVGTGIWWDFDGHHATMGMIIVSPEYQGMGLGRTIMNGLLGEAEPRLMLLNATRAGEPLYSKLGFVACGEVEQFQGQPRPSANAPETTDLQIRAAADSDIEAISLLDQKATGMHRRLMLLAVIASGEAIVLTRSATVIGYSLCRLFGKGRVIGPVVCDDGDQARSLISHWLRRYPSDFMRVDIHVTTGLGPWLVEQGLYAAGRVTSMVRGDLPAEQGGVQVYALASQAFG